MFRRESIRKEIREIRFQTDRFQRIGPLRKFRNAENRDFVRLIRSEDFLLEGTGTLLRFPEKRYFDFKPILEIFGSEAVYVFDMDMF